ncbi:MAG: YcbK family protein [bacterium]
MNSTIFEHNLSRRSLIKLGLFTLGASIINRPAFAAINSFVSSERRVISPEKRLFFYNTHTEETLKVIYWYNGEYLYESLNDINYILRDHYTGEIKTIDIRLIELLHDIYDRIETKEPFHIVSGYRTRFTNSLLRRNNRGVARRSMHIYGKAVDIYLPDCKLSSLRKTAIDLKSGGVGYYPFKNFVHVDVGRVRCW